MTRYQLPNCRQFQKVSIDADTAAKIREALEAGESLPFAHLAERGTNPKSQVTTLTN